MYDDKKKKTAPPLTLPPENTGPRMPGPSPEMVGGAAGRPAGVTKQKLPRRRTGYQRFR